MKDSGDRRGVRGSIADTDLRQAVNQFFDLNHPHIAGFPVGTRSLPAGIGRSEVSDHFVCQAGSRPTGRPTGRPGRSGESLRARGDSERWVRRPFAPTLDCAILDSFSRCLIRTEPCYIEFIDSASWICIEFLDFKGVQDLLCLLSVLDRTCYRSVTLGTSLPNIDRMHLSVISNPTSPPDQISSSLELEPMSTSEDEDIANNNEHETHSSLSASSSTTDSELSSNLHMGYFDNGNLNELASNEADETEELIRKAAQTILDRTPLRVRQISQSRSLHSIRAAPSEYRLQLRNEHGEIRQQLAMLDIAESELPVAPAESQGSQGALREETKVGESRTPRRSRVQRPTSFPCRRKPIRLNCMTPISTDDQSFSARKTRLMAEARLALAQAPELAKRELQKLRETRNLKRRSAVASLLLPPGSRRFNRTILSKLTVRQLQLILNDLHEQVESLNEDLVKLLLQRDELNMERDGKLVEIEDLDRIEPDCNTSLLSTLVQTM